MFITIRNCLLWVLGVFSILAGWQGVSASAAIAGWDDASNVSGPWTEAAAVTILPDQPEPVENNHVESSLPSPLTQPTEHYSPATQQPPVKESSWPKGRIQAMSLPDSPSAGPPVLVAILDTGIDRHHEDLSGRVIAEIGFVEGSSTDDRYGHGTPIAGIIAADPDNGSGVAGLAPESRLINIKVADDQGKCQDTAVADGIIWAVDNGARVINVSIEIGESTQRLEDAVEYAWSHGAVIVAAAGNDGNSRPVYPAAYDYCLSVTAIRENGELAPLANYGEWVDVAAPGFDIYTTLPGNTFGYKHGTSFATAYVSALAALLYPLVSDTDGDGVCNDEVLQAIFNGCQDIGITGTGQGLINVANSLREVKKSSTQ